MIVKINSRNDLYFETTVGSDVVSVSVKSITTNKYFNGVAWGYTKTLISIPGENFIFKYIFTPEWPGEYQIEFVSEKTKSRRAYNLIVKPSNDVDAPVQVSNETLMTTNGETTEVVDNDSLTPISGATISCFNKDDKKLAAITQSDSDGKWSFYITPGEYIFIFAKDGYLSTTFERLVI